MSARKTGPEAAQAVARALFELPQDTMDEDGLAREPVPGTGGLLCRGQSALAFSQRGAGKSIVALTIGLSAASKGEQVYYWDRENGAADTRQRAEAILEANDWPDVFASGQFVGRHYPQLSRDWDPHHVAMALFGFNLVIYDSFREGISQLGGDPNSDSDISRFVDLAVTPLVRCGTAVLILDNTGHDEKNRPKGSGAKLDAIPQVYKLVATSSFNVVESGRVTLECVRSRFGDIGRKWTARMGDGVYEVPRANDQPPEVKAVLQELEAKKKFWNACVDALRERAPLGRDPLLKAVRSRGVQGRHNKLREWLSDFADDPSKGLISGPAGYDLTPGPDSSGQGGATPSEDPLAPDPLPLKGAGRASGPGPGREGHATNGAASTYEEEVARLGIEAYDDGEAT